MVPNRWRLIHYKSVKSIGRFWEAPARPCTELVMGRSCLLSARLWRSRVFISKSPLEMRWSLQDWRNSLLTTSHNTRAHTICRLMQILIRFEGKIFKPLPLGRESSWVLRSQLHLHPLRHPCLECVQADQVPATQDAIIRVINGSLGKGAWPLCNNTSMSASAAFVGGWKAA